MIALDRGNTTPHRTRTPLRSCRSAHTLPSSGPIAAANGTASASTTVTGAPRLLADAATSDPMNPAPTTMVRAPASSAERISRASSTVRSVCTPARCSVPGSVAARAPVAMISAS